MQRIQKTDQQVTRLHIVTDVKSSPLKVVKTKKRSDHQLIRKVTVFARQLMRHEKELTFGEIMIYAWDEMKKFGHLYELKKYKNTKGVVCQRIVLRDKWINHNTVKGTGRPLKEGQLLFVDVARLHCGARNSTISMYKNNIIESF